MADKFGCFKDKQRSLAHYLGNSEEELLQYVAAQMGIDVGVLNSLHQYAFQKGKEEFSVRNVWEISGQLLGMQLHGQFEKSIEGLKNYGVSQKWLKHSDLKRGNECVIMAAYERALHI